MENENGSGSGDEDEGFLLTAGAEGETLRPALLAWIPRVTGTLSLIGSCLILWDIWVVRRRGSGKMTRRLYTEIITAISICDIFGSVGWIFSTLPMPTYVEDEELDIEVNSNIYGAKGSDLTCTLQGIIMQIGITGIFFFVSLTFYYLFTIRYGYRENRMNSLRWYFHLPPLLLGLLFVGAGFAELDYSYVACYGETEEFLGSFFARLPFWLAFTVTPIALFMTLMHVRTTDRKANKWRYSSAEESSRRMSPIAISEQGAKAVSDFSNMSSLPSENAASESLGQESQSSRAVSSVSIWSQETQGQPETLKVRNESTDLESVQEDSVQSSVGTRSSAVTSSSMGSGPPSQLTRAVFWQFIFYLLSFWFTWPVFFLGKIDALETNFAYLVLVVSLTPLQGFFNAFVYFRPTVSKEYANWKQGKKAKKLLKKEGAFTPLASKSHTDKQLSPLDSIAEADEESARARRAAAPVEGLESVME